MLYRADDNMSNWKVSQDTLNRQIIRFGPAGGKEDFTRSRTQPLSHFGTRGFNVGFHLPARQIRSRWIVKIMLKIRLHSLQHFIGEWRRRRIIKINRVFHNLYSNRVEEQSYPPQVGVRMNSHFY